LYLCAYFPLQLTEDAGDWDTLWKWVNFTLVLLQFVKVNQYLQIFESFSFLVQMIQAVIIELRNFLAYYLLVMITFGFVFKVVFDTAS
jgi:Polycystin cation channel